MGKAGKWIRNFLFGKNEDKNKKKKLKNGASFSAEYHQNGSPKLRLKWSFGKSSGKLKAVHKVSRSLDSIDTNKLIKQVISEPDEATSEDVENVAATKIQSVYRSHLARKALNALRGLVKIQALVRGHLVRKQTAATLRGMQALMAIQVRARVHRIQMVDQQHQLLLQTRPSSFLTPNNFPQNKFNGSGKVLAGRMDMNNLELQSMKSKSDYISHSQIARIKHELTTFYSKQKISFSNHQQQQQHDQYDYEDHSFTSEPNSPLNYPSWHKTINPAKPSFHFHQPDYYLDPDHHDRPFLPNYTSNTRSSKAKVRSHSEPKQRPGLSMMQKGKQIEYSGDNRIRNSSGQLKIYGPKRYSKERTCDFISTMSSHMDDYGQSHVGYEVRD